MFVLRSTHMATVAELIVLRTALKTVNSQFSALLRQWNELVDRINAKGGEQFLEGTGAPRLDGKDIQKLLLLCHPDKHGGKDIAEEMTRKLLTMRDRPAKARQL